MKRNQAKLKKSLLLASSLALASINTAAQESMDDVLGVFEELDDELVYDQDADIATAGTTGPLGWEHTGSLVLSYAWNYEDHFSSTGTDYKGLSKLRLRANWQADKEFNENWSARVSAYVYHDLAYQLNDRSDYTDQVLDEYETDIDTQELYLLGKLSSNADLKLGRQVVIWGRADNLRVLDVLNPLDSLEPGLADIEDLRLPVTMAKLDYYLPGKLSGWKMSFIAIPEIRSSKYPPVGSDFNYTTDLNGQATEFYDDIPDDWKHQNWGAAVSGTVKKWDITLNAARFWRDTPTLDVRNFDTSNLPASIAIFDQTAYLKHSRVDMLGGSLQTTTGSWLFKTELAWFDGNDYTGYGFYNVPGIGTIPLPDRNYRRDQLDTLLGAEYFGIANTTISLELVNRHIIDYEENMAIGGVEENETEIAFRITRNFINDRLDVTFVTINFNEGDDGSITRLDAKYEIRGGLNATAGILVFGSGETDPLAAYQDNDRVFAELKWSF